MTRDDKLNGLEHYERFLDAQRFEPVPPMTDTKKPMTERVCECGHDEDEHDDPANPPPEQLGCCADGGSCPCPAFTPKKEDKK